MKTYYLGTRQSLLARVQAEQMAQELQQKTGTRWELKTYLTQGDRQTDRPLWQMDGKDFFTKELDEKLLRGEVDAVVHSYKDLGSERPQDLEVAAVAARRFAQDILLIPQHKVLELHRLKKLTVGTSAPRRQYLLKNLPSFLPRFQGIVASKELRGNINTRIEKLLNGEYDAIILAFSGLNRLSAHPEGRSFLLTHLAKLNFSILPTKVFTPAPAQGALAIECRRQNQEVKKLLQSIDDPETHEKTTREKQLFAQYGGGCHLALGTHIKFFKGHRIQYQRGLVDEQVIEESLLGLSEKQEFLKEKIEKHQGYIFSGMPRESFSQAPENLLFDESFQKIPLMREVSPERRHYFVTSRYALKYLEYANISSVWTSGVMTWKKTALQGHWVHGCAESLGSEEVAKVISSEFFKIFCVTHGLHLSPTLYSLTHTQNTQENTLPTYEHRVQPPASSWEEKFKKCTLFFWTGPSQWTYYREKFPFITDPSCIHACGLGKTYAQLIADKITPIPYLAPKNFFEVFDVY